MSRSRTIVLIPALALLLACDNAKRSDVDGLQQRLDTIAGEQAAMRKRMDDGGDAKAEATAREQLRTDLQAELATTKAELEALKARVAKLESPAVPALPTRKPLAGSPDPAERYAVTIADAFASGPADAKVTVVIFSDFQCPFCARVQTTLKELQTDYKDDVRIVAKHLPLPMHVNAMGAALAAEAAGKQGKFWELHDKLYENGRALSEAEIEGYAKDLGLDMKRFRTDRDAAATKSIVDAHAKQADSLGARGTPSFFINGKYLSGAQPLVTFKAIVDAEIVEADLLIARGVAKRAVYDELMSTAKPGVGR